MNWPTKKLGEVLEINYGKGLPKDRRVDSGKYFAYGSNGPVYSTDESLTNGETVVIGRKGTAGALYFISDPCWPIDTTFFAKPKSDVSLKFIYYTLQTKRLPRLAIVTGVPGINRTTLANINIQLPPIATQKQIVERLDKIAEAQKLNDELIQKTDELFQSLLHQELNPAGKDWEVKKLGELFEITSSKRVFESEWTKQGVPFYRAREIVSLAKNQAIRNPIFISGKMFEEYKKKYGAPQEGDILVTGVGTLGISYVVKDKDRFYFKDGNIIWLKKIPNSGASSQFVEYFFQTPIFKQQIEATSAGATVRTYTIRTAQATKIPLPPLETQKQIVAKLSAVQEYKNQLLAQKSKLKELFDSALAKSFRN